MCRSVRLYKSRLAPTVSLSLGHSIYVTVHNSVDWKESEKGRDSALIKLG